MTPVTATFSRRSIRRPGRIPPLQALQAGGHTVARFPLRIVVAREESIIQTKTVLLISLLAMARRFIVMDLTAASSLELLGLATVTLALGGTYWLMRERDDRPAAPSANSST